MIRRDLEDTFVYISYAMVTLAELKSSCVQIGERSRRSLKEV